MNTTLTSPPVIDTKKYRGIVFYRTGKWLAKTTGCGKNLSLGYYDDPVEAAKAYDCANLLLGRSHVERNIPGLPDLAMMEKINAILSAKGVVTN